MKLLYTTIILLCLSPFGHAQTKTASNESFVSLSFTGLHCDGKNGLCALEPSAKQLANATLIYNENGTLFLFINREQLNAMETETFFGRAYDEDFRALPITFEVGKEFILGAKILQELKMNSVKNKIVLDNYPIQITDSHYIITLNLE